MTQRNKLELAVNQPTEIELLYDEPVTGKSQYGNYFMYAVNSNGQEYTFFAPEEVHSQLKELSKGDKAVITKLASQRGTKLVTSYDVQPTTEKEGASDVESTDRDQSDNVECTQDRLFHIMKNSYLDALELSKELNGLVDVHRCAITLYLSRAKQ